MVEVQELVGDSALGSLENISVGAIAVFGDFFETAVRELNLDLAFGVLSDSCWLRQDPVDLNVVSIFKSSRGCHGCGAHFHLESSLV